jgi:serine protease Do
MGSVARHSMIILFVVALLAAACGGGAEETTTTTTDAGTTTTVTVAESTTTTTEASGAVSDLKDVRSAVVRIVGEGSFVDPEYGEVSNVSGSGSGFIIDPNGLAVTNNHVVTGAAFLQVYVEGEDEPRNAKILGVSECSDLAVIDIDGDDFPYLEWWDGDITTGTEIYVAGFPLGDPEYTLTEGIISKEKADGDTYSSSVDSVLEHTARSMPGNSGGPLVTTDGEVVGVHYQSRGTNRDIKFAISRDEASNVLDSLIAGDDVNSIGVNGRAFVGDEFSGIWVSAVQSGSPAASLSIKGGDIITEIEGLVLATDGTMADYCDILRSHDATDPLAIEILRFDTEEVLEGTLNGDEDLTLAFSFAQELGDDVGNGTGAAYEYAEVYDDDGILVMMIPTTWAEIDGSGWEVDGTIVGNAITAAPSLDGFYNTWDTPGVVFAASQVLVDETDPGDLLSLWDFTGVCDYDGNYAYEDAIYAGAYDLWLGCGGTNTAYVVLEAYPPEEDFVVLIQIQIVSDADLDAFDTILATFDLVSG